MSYLALARKWRPHKFSEVVGQQHVLTALENALDQNRLHHAYLFSGTRGVGKTTIGRLFAKGLNCETGITSQPCGACDTCCEIDEGRFVDLLEIDAASRTKVEDTRELLDNVQYKPARGRFKVYLIDEVHMLSRHSFNALLKTLEEPPEYVKFLLATTDPQKLPVTILSRCLQFHLKPIGVDDIQGQLDHILGQEGVDAEPRAISLISHAADGSMRDALSLTDQAIALGNGAIQADTVAHMLGTIDKDQAVHLLEAIASKAPQQAMQKLEELAQNGVEWDGLLAETASQLHRIAMYQALPATLDQSQPDAERISQLSKALSPQDVQLYYQIAIKGRDDLALAPNGRVGLEMIVLRMLAFRPATVQTANSISTEVAQNNAPAPVQAAPQPVQPSQQGQQHQPSAQPAQLQSTQPQSAPQQASPSQGSVPQGTVPQGTVPQGTVSHGQGTAPQGMASQDMPPQYEPQSTPPAYDSGYQGYDAAPPPYSDTPQGYPESGHADSAPHSMPAPQATNEPAQQPNQAAPSPVSGLRHQLRSQRKGLQNQAGSGNSPKKPRAASEKESVLDRLAQKHGTNAPVPPKPSQSGTPEVDPNEPYQWRPSQPVEKTVKKELTPTQLKRALEHEKTPEMIAKLVEESQQQDDWTRTIGKLDTAKLVEQLALNSHFKKSGSTIELVLRPNQAHLNTERAQSELLAALNHAFAEECHLSVTIGEEGQTPLELRDTLYQGKLQQAFTSLEQDPNVQFIATRFAAELDRDSVRPV